MLNYAILFLFYIAIFHCFLFTISCPPPNTNLYYQPVIGILSHPGDGTSGRHSNATGASFIHASYVKFVEAAGARVVPLIYNEPEEKILKVSEKSSNLKKHLHNFHNFATIFMNQTLECVWMR